MTSADEKETTAPSAPSGHPLAERISDIFHRRVVRIKNQPYAFVRAAATFIGVGLCMWIVWITLHPDLIFADTTPTGGDMGAHVWWPAFIRDFLLPHGRIFGWTMDNYSGFPIGQYYFPVPALMVIFFDVFLPYNIAFKIVTVLGSVFLPLSAYVMGRCIKAPKPIPLLMSFAAMAFLFFGGDPRGTSSGTASTLVNYSNANFNHHIMGGPILSSMAGEFSFSIALTFALLFLGTFFVMLREGKHRCLVSILFALTVMSHLVVAIFLGFAALAFWGASYAARKGITRWLGYALLGSVISLSLAIGIIGEFFFDRTVEKSLTTVSLISMIVFGCLTLFIVGSIIYCCVKDRKTAADIGRDTFPLFVGFLLSSVWLVPLLARFQYTSNMRYEKLVDVVTTPGVNEVYELYILPSYMIKFVFVPAAIGFIISAALLRKSIIPILVTALVMGAVFVQWPEGHAWNLRFLPFFYLFIFFVAAAGYGEVFRLPSVLVSRLAYTLHNRSILTASKYVRTGTVIVLIIFGVVQLIGFGSVPKDTRGCPTVDDRFFADKRGLAPGWARFNFEGYERKPQRYCGQEGEAVYKTSEEYKKIMEEMSALPQGRALWETIPGVYGTTLALMLLPYFTDHRVASQEGLYFEAAGSTAYHFLTVAELSKNPSNPMRWPVCAPGSLEPTDVEKNCWVSAYGNLTNDFHRGVQHMQMMGVKYYMAFSPEAIAAADTNGDLTLIKKLSDVDGTEPLGFNIYQVKDSPVVEAIAQQPVVVTDKSSSADWSQSGNRWLYYWFNAVDAYPILVQDGPKNWKRQTARKALSQPLSDAQRAKKPKVKVSDIKVNHDSVSFHVDKIGEPVLVKVSYYPTFSTSGASEVYRASPNFMVVVPTEKDVTIKMERDAVEWGSNIAFFLGILALLAMAFSVKFSKRRNFRYLSILFGPKR